MCKKNVKILYKCTKYQSGNYCSKACQTKQYPEHKKYCAVISELDSRKKHKLEQFTVTDSEILPKKYHNQLVRLIGEKPIIEGYINPLSAKFMKWSNTLKQIVGKLPTICLSVFDHFSGLARKGLMIRRTKDFHW